MYLNITLYHRNRCNYYVQTKSEMNNVCVYLCVWAPVCCDSSVKVNLCEWTFSLSPWVTGIKLRSSDGDYRYAPLCLVKLELRELQTGGSVVSVTYPTLTVLKWSGQVMWIDLRQKSLRVSKMACQVLKWNKLKLEILFLFSSVPGIKYRAWYILVLCHWQTSQSQI